MKKKLEFSSTQLEKGPFYDTMLDFFDFKYGFNPDNISNNRVLELINEYTIPKFDTILVFKKSVDVVKEFPKILWDNYNFINMDKLPLVANTNKYDYLYPYTKNTDYESFNNEYNIYRLELSTYDNFKNFISYLKFKNIECNIFSYIRPDKYILI